MKKLAALASITAALAVPALASAHSLTMSRSTGARAIIQYGQRVLRLAELDGDAEVDRCQLSVGMQRTAKDLFCMLTLGVTNSYGTTVAFCRAEIDAYWPSRSALRPRIVAPRSGFYCSTFDLAPR